MISATTFSSIRVRIVAWILLVVFTALASVLYLTDAVRRGEIHTHANTTVEQEIAEFSTFVTESPRSFNNSRELVEAYLGQEIPMDQQLLIGQIGDQVVRQQISTPYKPADKAALLHEIFTSHANSGIFNGVHWGRVELTSPNSEKPDYFATAIDTKVSYSHLSNQTKNLSVMGAVVMALAVIIAWLISNQIIIPIRSLRDVASQISDSSLTSRVPITGDDEIADLARTFNHMLDRIDSAYQIQRQFIDDAGHELRTPITVIRGNLELLETATPQQRARSIDLCTGELDRMTRMVNDLLTLAIADADGPKFLHLTQCDLSELMIDIEDKAEIVSDGRAHVTKIAEGVVILDAQRITEAVLELTRNAVKYTPDGSPILIESSREGNQISISVRDFGPGVDPKVQQNLFSRFTRGQKTQSDQVPKKGAGLGLSIVRVIAEAHGGHAWVKSEPGLGATFGFSFPAVT